MKDRENPFAPSPFISDNIWSYMNNKDWKVIGNSFRARSNSINKIPTLPVSAHEQKEGRKRSMSLNNISMYKDPASARACSGSSPVSAQAAPAHINRSVVTEKGNLSLLRRHSLDPSIFNSIARTAVSLERPNMRLAAGSFCIVQFGSGNRCFGMYKDISLMKGTFVIIEADRGEDCGSVILDAIDSFQMSELSIKYNITTVETRKIHRVATDEDKLLLLEQNMLEQVAVSNCCEKVKERKLPMEIVSAEYQWDRNKLTFYFKSDKRIDFRDLVKELYKSYKTRIWMCAVEKKGGKNIIYKHE
ncbi:uncharacterized protein NEMAJ01_1385 [Nematocida major]|uniref:uncharacterized protein n=1 Tax=Nematocida major TaxID=1912982 RepID=UPI0020088A89|nr:uncharacterized protein NEMAJ01_1385 [Nematocida major]KAH9386489.1 hypothetical protein NEMAJ01_1385 [Nematocida major]